MIFNGSASDRQSWFNRKLLEKSYWTSLANDTQVFWFSFQGETFSGLSRRFIIFSYYWNCWSDSMYFMAIDSAYESCSPYWGPIPSYPMFFYSPVNQMVRPSAQPPGEYIKYTL
ncbi:hypothetical protein BgiBS90_027145 [Biomphalaria glabrata]|nr:hypothetical protein BgiBS90_027145 [Biomphalaria glabrata]